MESVVKNWLSLLLSAALLLGMAGYVAAGASRSLHADGSASVQALVHADAHASPSERLAARLDKLADTRGKLEARAEELEQDAQAREAALKARLDARFGAAVEQIQDQREKDLEQIRDHEAHLKVTLKQLREKAELTDEEKTEFKAEVSDSIETAFDERIALAQRLESEGANATLVADFVAYANAKKTAFANATTVEQKEAIVVDFNAHWRAFKQAVANGVISERLVIAIQRGHAVLAQLDVVIARLSAANFSTAGLSEASASVNASLNAAAHASTLDESMFYLRQAHRGLVFLKNAIERTVNNEVVEAFETELPPESVKEGLRINLGLHLGEDLGLGDDGLAKAKGGLKVKVGNRGPGLGLGIGVGANRDEGKGDEDEVSASPTLTASPTPSATPTASPSVSALASASTAASADHDGASASNSGDAEGSASGAVAGASIGSGASGSDATAAALGLTH